MLAHAMPVAARVNLFVVSWKRQGRLSRSIGFQTLFVVVVDGLMTLFVSFGHAMCERQRFG